RATSRGASRLPSGRPGRCSRSTSSPRCWRSSAAGRPTRPTSRHGGPSPPIPGSRPRASTSSSSATPDTICTTACAITGSSGARAVAERFAAYGERFRVAATAHQGLVAALGAGLERCLGRMVARMDADDVMHRERLAAQLRALDAEPALAAVGCHVRLFPRRELSDGLRAYERWLDGIDSPRRVRAEAFVECPVAHPTLMVRAEVLHRAAYRDAGWPEDYDLVLRLLGQGHEIGVVPRRLLAWRDGPRRLWRAGEAYRPERFTACKAAFLAAHFLAGADRYVLWGYGPTGRAL